MTKKTNLDPMTLSLRKSQVEALKKLITDGSALRETLCDFTADERTALDSALEALGVNVARTLPECRGHEPDPAMPNQPPGETFYCDGTCRAHELDAREDGEACERRGSVCDSCGGEFDDTRDGLCAECSKRDEFKVQLDFAPESNLDAEVNGVCEQHGIDAWYLVELEGPAGGNPVVEFRGTHASLKSLCDVRGCDEGEYIEAVEEGDEPAKGIELRRRPWKVVPIKPQTDGGAVMSVVYDESDPLEASSGCAKRPWCVLQVGHSGDCSSTFIPTTLDVMQMLDTGEETGGGDLSDAQIVEALS